MTGRLTDLETYEWRIKPADAAEVIAFLLSDAAVAINGSGITLAVS